MKFTVKKSQDRMISIAFLSLLVLLSLSVLTNCILGGFVWRVSSTQKTITTPMMFDQPFVSNSVSTDQNANAMFVRSFVNLRLNVTPETIDQQQRLILLYTLPDFRSSLKKALDVEARYIKDNGVSSVFIINDISVNPQTGESIVHGVQRASTSNGKLVLKDTPKTYILKIQYENGLVKLLEFSEVNNEKNNG
ncbi:type IV conjugative transfer system protein TraE [Rouxiella badensis]|uniref:type IV conjugative transfer system protein TraE n=1 Tax=Rouxiella badensis TaxID=1646377 RepID=UPI001787D98A|nr:type IV conjugative transfer system protein TraE [Rouxiella badensis]QOI58092.1 type IV conjugative transfer system protein TraE [Rouxiella badensis subsp. acadiensis]